MSVESASKNMERFRQNVIECFPGAGAAWLDQLPGLIQSFEQRWSIKVFEPFLLSYNFCAPGLHASGTEVVLKLGVPNPDFTHQIYALRAFDGHGMVRLLDADIDQGAMLLERLDPGEMLVNVVPDDEMATRIAAQLLLEMWVPAPPNYAFPTPADWANDFEKIRTHFEGRACPMPDATIQRTITLFSELLASPTQPFLFHGDYHHFNILSVSGDDGLGWRAIDPFGVVGDREADVGAFMKNPELTLPLTTELKRMFIRRLDIFQEVLGFDRYRLIAWSSVYSALSSWWTLSVDGADWEPTAVLADFYASLL